MLTLKNITIKNFMSIGAVTQSVNFENKDLVLVLGENLDLGGNDSRNGVGKSTLVNALSYALYGSALTNIKKNNLINKTNGKNMLVTLEFGMDGRDYRIERGRSPNKFSFFMDGDEIGKDETDEAQGDSRMTQAEVERVIGLSHTMFKQIVALNTYSEPFLSMRAHDQREIIEHLLGITKLSEKANVLKEEIKVTKDGIKEEEFRIKAINEANKRFEENIRSIKIKSATWQRKHDGQIEEIRNGIAVLSGVDIEKEIELHKLAAVAIEQKKKLQSIERDIDSYGKQLKSAKRLATQLEKQLATTEEKTCPTCGHDLEEHKHEEIAAKLTKDYAKATDTVDELEREIATLEQEKIDMPPALVPKTFYDSIEDAYNHRGSLEALENDLTRELARENPHIEQISDMENSGIQEIDYATMNTLTELRDHQEFLLKLLTSKDSFIRKKIIDQNLAYLNSRLKHYLEKLGLPHSVKFLSDLNVEITEHGRDLDFDNLSRGERTRLILSLSFSFRDVYESLNSPISLLFIDELIDNGLDTAGVESALGVLKKISRDSKKNIFLISHKDELIGRVDNVLRVVKEGGFTSIDEESDLV